MSASQPGVKRGARPANRRAIPAIAVGVLLVLSGAAAAALPHPPPSLSVPSEAALRGVAPYLERRELLIFESSPDGTAAQVTAVSLLPHPVEEVLAVLSDPANFRVISKNLVRVDPVARKEGCAEYDWEVEVPFFNLEGRNRLCADPAERRVSIHTVAGEVVPSGSLWRLYPLDGGKTLVAFASFSDVSRASWFLAKMIEESPIKEQAMVAESGFSTLRGVKTFLAERALHAGDPSWRVEQSGVLTGTPELSDAFDPAQAIPLPALTPLLARGEVAVFRYAGAGVRSALELVRVYASVAARAQSVRGWVEEPRRWMGLVPDLLRVQALSGKGQRRRFRMTFGYSVMTMDMDVDVDTGVPGWALRAAITGGEMGGGVLGWQVRGTGPRACVLASTRLTDAMSGSVVLREMAEANPLARQSMNMNRGFLAVRAIKLAAEKVARYGL